MGEQILEDVALDVGAEPVEVNLVEFVDHLFQHVRIDNFKHRVAKVIGHLRLVLDQRRHIGKDLVADEVAQPIAAFEAPPGPAEALSLVREEACVVAAGESAPEFTGGLFLVEELQVDEVGDLFDVGDGVRHPSRPEDVGDPV